MLFRSVLLGVAFYSSWKVQSFAEVISADLDAAAEAIRNADHPAARQALADGAARCDQMRTSMNHLLRTADFTELEAALRRSTVTERTKPRTVKSVLATNTD